MWPITTLEPELGFFELAKKNKRFPSAKARFCTVELKIKPTLKHISTLYAQGNTVLLHSGVRAGESHARSKMLERAYDGNMLCEVFRPLLTWTIDDVWAIHKKYRIPRNPLYDHGCKRVGCLPCVMSQKGEIREIADRFPETIDRIRKAEDESLTELGNRSSFFMNKVPTQFRTRDYVSSKGREIKVSGIDDVIRWAQTEKGAKRIMAGRDENQPTFDFIERGLDIKFDEDDGETGCNSGFCE